MLYQVTVKQMRMERGVRIDKGMSVQVVTNSYNNPILDNHGQAVEDAFMRIYGISLRQMNALNMAYLESTRIG